MRIRQRPEGRHAAKRSDAKARRSEATSTAVAGATPGGDDSFERDEEQQKRRSWFARATQPQLATKKSAHASSVFVAGVEIAVRVNHVDPLNDGRRDVKANWVADGENLAVDIESVLLRRDMPKGMRFELQGPALQAKADGETLPLRARFVGMGVTTSVAGEMPRDPTPPRAEVKIEVKLTDRSIGSLAGLAGASAEINSLLAEIEGTEAARVVGEVLLTAVPVVSTAVALVSARRALKTVRDTTAGVRIKALAVLRALADAVTVVLPLVGTLANLALVGLAVANARHEARKATPATGPPS